MLLEKALAEELDKNNQTRLQNIFGKFLYYDMPIDPTILMSLNSLVAVQINPTAETTKQITQILNYIATHPDAVTEYRRIRIILYKYLDASHISELEERSRAVGYFS